MGGGLADVGAGVSTPDCPSPYGETHDMRRKTQSETPHPGPPHKGEGERNRSIVLILLNLFVPGWVNHVAARRGRFLAACFLNGCGWG
jgi:hypothetical protein